MKDGKKVFHFVNKNLISICLEFLRTSICAATQRFLFRQGPKKSGKVATRFAIWNIHWSKRLGDKNNFSLRNKTATSSNVDKVKCCEYFSKSTVHRWTEIGRQCKCSTTRLQIYHPDVSGITLWIIDFPITMVKNGWTRFVIALVL